jgi:iron-sulfur cluster insertion protein
MMPKSNQSKIEITQAAAMQIELIQNNDFTVKDFVFRLHIDGKGCDGFTYALGFDSAQDDDIVMEYENVKLHVDPFTAHYCQEGRIDFLMDLNRDMDGFVFITHNQDK